ncbi:MAG: hypothetical protein H8E40_06350 [Chloroflexi bacterium]|nr:hypothetical protein [Chloroflexota bacterium]
MRIAVIADNLTGALDTGVQFTQWGYTAQLTDAPERSAAEVTIINTDTRNKTPEIAYRITYTVAERLDQHDIIYKKIIAPSGETLDRNFKPFSTLREKPRQYSRPHTPQHTEESKADISISPINPSRRPSTSTNTAKKPVTYPKS